MKASALRGAGLPLALFASTMLGCFYALDSEELEAKASGALSPAARADAGPEDGDGGSAFTTSLDTPAIELDFEGEDTTRDPCVITTAQATEILTQSCAPCHAPPASMGSFNSILDFPKLVTVTSNTTNDPDTLLRARLVVPGNPDGSRLYRRVQAGEMPPQRMPPLPRPTTSDISILRTWITSCLPAVDPPRAVPAADAGLP